MDYLKDPAIIAIILQVIALVVAKFDRSDSIANLVIKLGELLKSKNQQVVKDRDTIVAKIVAIGYMEQFISSLRTNLTGIDNPEQRVELLRQIEAYEAEGESDGR